MKFFTAITLYCSFFFLIGDVHADIPKNAVYKPMKKPKLTISKLSCGASSQFLMTKLTSNIKHIRVLDKKIVVTYQKKVATNYKRNYLIRSRDKYCVFASKKFDIRSGRILYVIELTENKSDTGVDLKFIRFRLNNFNLIKCVDAVYIPLK